MTSGMALARRLSAPLGGIARWCVLSAGALGVCGCTLNASEEPSGESSQGLGATITVTSLADSGAGTLRQALLDVADGDTIDFSVAGTITLTSAALVIDKDVNIVGPGAGALAISGNMAHRVLEIGANVVSLSDLTIRDGFEFSTAGMSAAPGSVTTLTRLVVTRNIAEVFVGGIANAGDMTIVDSAIVDNETGDDHAGILSSGTLTVIHSDLSRNTGVVSGGAIEMSGGELTLVDSTLDDNSIGYGAGVLLRNAGATITGCKFRRNRGGAIDFAYGTASVTVTDSLIAHNSGSGIFAGGSLDVLRTTIVSNSGGGIVGDGFRSGLVSITASTIADNTSADGAGINTGKMSFAVINSTISGNVASGSGGGVFVANGGGVVMLNATLANNEATVAGASIYPTASVGNTLITSTSPVGNCALALTSTGNNLSNDASCGLAGPGDLSSVDPKIGPLQLNGGPTMTHALLPGSPAIDAGGPYPLVDQRGVTRPQGSASDIGAYELVHHRHPHHRHPHHRHPHHPH